MAVTAKVFGKLPQSQINWTSDTIKVALMTASYTPNQDTQQFWGDTGVSSTEVTGGGSTGYTAGGATLGGKSVNYDASTNANQFRASATTWTTGSGGTLTASFAVVYKDTGTAATSPLIAYVDFGGAQTASNGQAFTLTWDATLGVYTATPA